MSDPAPVYVTPRLIDPKRIRAKLIRIGAILAVVASVAIPAQVAALISGPRVAQADLEGALLARGYRVEPLPTDRVPLAARALALDPRIRGVYCLTAIAPDDTPSRMCVAYDPERADQGLPRTLFRGYDATAARCDDVVIYRELLPDGVYDRSLSEVDLEACDRARHAYGTARWLAFAEDL